MTVEDLEREIRRAERIVVKFNDNIEKYPCYFTNGMLAVIEGEYAKAEGVFITFDDAVYKKHNQQLKINDSRDVQFNSRYYFCVGGYMNEIDCFEKIESTFL